MTGSGKPMTDAEIDAASVGGVEAGQTIEVVDYDPDWPAQFERGAGRIRAALGAAALSVEHVGSTSVPGLAAKPIIDINLAVADSSLECAYLPQLSAAGYRLAIREPEFFEHRMFKGADPAVNLHVFSAGCPELDRMRLFRDWLRQSPEDVALYAETKRRLAARTWTCVQNYADAKTKVVQAILARAEAWAVYGA